MSMGSDNTFLRSQALTWNDTIPILGINTNRQVYEGVLNSAYIDPGKKEEHSFDVLSELDDLRSVKYEKRSRLLFECYKQDRELPLQRTLCLNELMVAEKDIS